ncbi:MAG: hypothetical protein JWL75_592 [Parcubacteria group bacterium]|nr:hypothetical protein [Parcubacteria group bacterium]
MKLGDIRKSWIALTLAASILFLLGIAAGYALRALRTPTGITTVRDPDSVYSLINPVLYIETPESFSFPKYTPLESALSANVTQAKKDGSATDISIYYRDLNSSEWIGVNQAETYNPASMLKVITLIGVLRASESNPHLLSDHISVPASISIPTAGGQEYYPPADPVHSGMTYSVQDLLQRMIVQSDNGANALLTTIIGDSTTNANYTNLHISLPKNGTTLDISPQEYSHLFRVLYNSSYLNNADSEYALQLLSHTTFTPGLAAGIPASTTVAHKFGENIYPNNALGLNDCGIIYYPGHPYFLCVMTKGSDFSTLASVIKNISQITWQQVKLVYPS